MSNLLETAKDFSEKAEGTPDNRDLAKETLSVLLMWLDSNCPEMTVKDVDGEISVSSSKILIKGPRCSEQGVLIQK